MVHVWALNCFFFHFLKFFSISIFQLKHNQNQYCWLLQKNHGDAHANHGYETFQKFLDNHQYSRYGILRYEKVFGEGYVSTGGAETTEV